MDNFDRIHSLLRCKKYENVLAALFDSKRDRIKKQYDSNLSDKNHSWYIVGDIFYKKGQFKKALHAFAEAVKASKVDVEALLAIGDCYSELGRPVMAERYFKKGLILADESYKSALTYNLGNALFDQGKFIEAIKQYKLINKKDKKIYSLAIKNIKKASEKIEQRRNLKNKR